MFDWLINLDWHAIIVSILLSNGLGLYLIKKSIDHGLSKNLEKYKQDLKDISENKKFDYQRKLTDFNLYTTKKHENYIALYDALSNANSSIIYLTSPLRERDSYDWCNREDIINHLKTLNLPQGKTDEILKAWDNDKESAKNVIRRCVTLKEELDTDNSVFALKKAYLDAQLYLSPELLKSIDLLIKKYFSLSLDAKSEYRDSIPPKERKEWRGNIVSTLEEIQKSYLTILELMRTELSVGYYKADEK